VDVHNSLAADRRSKSKTKVKAGQGDKGDVALSSSATENVGEEVLIEDEVAIVRHQPNFTPPPPARRFDIRPVWPATGHGPERWLAQPSSGCTSCRTPSRES
jgi:hypothetical protein